MGTILVPESVQSKWDEEAIEKQREEDRLNAAKEAEPQHYEKFLPYMGNHHTYLPRKTGGYVACYTSYSRLGRYIGYPLTEELWEWLVDRFLVHHISVIRHTDGGVWTIGRTGRTATIWLGDDGLVSDIDLHIDNVVPPMGDS